MRFVKTVVMLTIFALALCSSAAHAQTATGGVNGTVTDQNGAVVPGATVTLVNRATNIQTGATAGEGGYSTFVNVSPGTYILRIEAGGFSTVQTSPFDVGVSQTLTQNVSLTVGAVTQTVEVTAGGELIQASSTELGTVIPERAIEDLPLNGPKLTQPPTLTPGVTPVSTSQNRNVDRKSA